MIFCTEKEAAICLNTNEGRMDYTGFFGKDSLFVNWVKELLSITGKKATAFSLSSKEKFEPMSLSLRRSYP